MLTLWSIIEEVGFLKTTPGTYWGFGEFIKGSAVIPAKAVIRKNEHRRAWINRHRRDMTK